MSLNYDLEKQLRESVREGIQRADKILSDMPKEERDFMPCSEWDIAEHQILIALLSRMSVNQMSFVGHRLLGIQCNHESNTDSSLCECGWGDTQTSIGEAFDSWLKHALSKVPASQSRISEEQVRKIFDTSIHSKEIAFTPFWWKDVTKKFNDTISPVATDEMLSCLNSLNMNWAVCRNTRSFQEGQPAEYWKKFDSAMGEAFKLQITLMKGGTR